MSETNPYQSPMVEPESPPSVARRRHSRLLWLVLPTVIGVVLGALFLPGGYPTPSAGRSIAGGIGGFVGLAAGFLVRLIYAVEESLPKD